VIERITMTNTPDENRLLSLGGNTSQAINSETRLFMRVTVKQPLPVILYLPETPETHRHQ
jgi:hypothetical protein